MPDDFIITHHFIHWRIRTRILITFPESRHAVHINSAERCAAACLPPAPGGQQPAAPAAGQQPGQRRASCPTTGLERSYLPQSSCSARGRGRDKAEESLGKNVLLHLAVCQIKCCNKQNCYSRKKKIKVKAIKKPARNHAF